MPVAPSTTPSLPRNLRYSTPSREKLSRFDRFLAWSGKLTERLLSTTKLFENIAFLTLLIACAALFAATVALWLRHFNPAPQIIIGKFSILSGTAQVSESLSDIVANQLSDSLDDVISSGAGYKGNRYASKSWQFKPLELPKIPVSRDFDITWKGVSLSQIRTAWNYLRHQQQPISGEIVPATDPNGAAPPGLAQTTALADSKPVTPNQLWIIHARLDGDSPEDVDEPAF